MKQYLRHIPNALTLLRIALVVPFAVLLLQEDFRVALVLLMVAGFTDALDGFLARWFHWRSVFGSIADPVADKFLLVTTYVCLGLLEQMAWWLVAVVVVRDLVIFSGAIAYWFLVGRYEGQPTLISKLCTFCQILVGIGVLVHLAFYPLPEIFFQIFPWLLLVLCILSLAQYLHWGIGDLRRRGQPEGVIGD